MRDRDSGAENNNPNSSNVGEGEGSESEGDQQQQPLHHQTAIAFTSGDGSFDTIKRKKTANKTRKPTEERRQSDSEQPPPRRSSSVAEVAGGDGHSGEVVTGEVFLSAASPPRTPRPAGGELSGVVGPDAASRHYSRSKVNGGGSGSPFGSELEPDSTTKSAGGGSSKNSPSTSPPLVSGPVRKHKSRDSGFVGRCLVAS